MASVAARLQVPWRDRRGRLSPLKATAFALIVTVPTYAMLAPVAHDMVGPAPEIFLTYVTGVWAIWLLLLSLAVTPARRIFGWNQLIAVRRMLGVAAVVYTLAHVAVFLWLIHYDVHQIQREFRRPTIWVATASTVGLMMLAATSLDAAVVAMGSRWWNGLHKLTYLLTGLALLHFVMSRASVAGLPFLVTGVFFWLMAWRALDLFGKGADPKWLLGLAAAVTAFTLAFEVGWLDYYRHRPPSATLRIEFDFRHDLSSTWQLLLLALSAALVPAALAKHRRNVARPLVTDAPAAVLPAATP